MRGFTGEYYNGIPVFIREEYERENGHKSECERLGDMLGASYDTLFGAMTVAEIADKRLLYNTGDIGRDLRLQGGSSSAEMWRAYKNGYVHEITGEYVECSLRPTFESFPAWRYVPIGYYGSPSSGNAQKGSGWGLFAALNAIWDIFFA